MGSAKAMWATMPFAEERVDAVPRAIEELVGNHEVERLVLFLERADRRDRNDSLHAQLFEAIDIRAEVQLGGKNTVSAAVTGEERDLAPFECSEDVGVRRLTERRLLPDFPHIAQPGHRVQPAASDDSNLRLRQTTSR